MIYVIDNDGEKSEYQPKKITHKIMEETGLDKEEAEKIQRSITYLIKDHYQEEYVSTTTLRSIINQKLIQKGYIEEEQKSQKLGMSISDFEELLQHGNNDNANIQYSPEMINKYASDSIAKQYALYSMPEDCSKAHIDGYVHHHDLEHYNLRPNCMNYDVRFFARNGLKIDGKGLMGSVSKPAKSLEVLLNHMLQAFMAGATVFSGGQGYANFNTLLAPFCRGRTYKEIKQAIQGFIFNCNMSLVCRGGQVLFSSIALDLSCPDVFANEPAVTFGGITQGTYKDYQEEADMIFRAVCEVSNEKDGQGRWHRFPNILFNIREGDLDEYSGTCKLLHETGANNPTIYYTNCTDLERTIMGCFNGSTKLHFWYNGKHYFETFSFIDNLINADYGATDVNNFKILGLADYEDSYWKNGEEIKFTSKTIRYVKASKFIKNEHRKIYHIILEDGNEFDCDDTHTMILCNGSYQKADIFEVFNNHLKICNIIKEPMSDKEGYSLNLSETYIKDIIATDNYEDTYCFEVDGTIIVDEFILTGNCRTALPMNYRKNYDDDCLNTGNFMYTTINLPLIAYESKDEEEFYKTLDYYCEIVYKTLHHRRAEVEKALYDLHTSDFLLQKDKETGKPLYTLDRATYTIGFCGLNEALLELYGHGVLEAHDEGVRIVQFLNDKKNEFNNRDGWRWSVIGSPAESTSSRFAKINKEKYADAIVQGEKGNYYLTNSSHIPVSDTSDIVEHIKNADTYHPLTLGGNLLHIWLGEVWSDPEALWKLNQKILKTNTRFWAYSKVFTYCQECEFTINDNLKKCPICGSEDLVVYDRITGYYLPVITRRGDDVSQQWNNGKLQEFKDRYRHDNILSKQ